MPSLATVTGWYHWIMDLSEFVRESLTEIIKGVDAAQNAEAAESGVINPSTSTQKTQVSFVRFDISIEVHSTTEGGGKLAIAGVGAGITAEESDRRTSRIQFVVPVALPSTEIEDPLMPPRLQIPPSGEIPPAAP